MVDQNFQRILLDLFSRKKYKDIILKVEEYSKRDNRPGGLSSLVGVCKMLNPNYTEEDIISALSDFEAVSYTHLTLPTILRV